MASDDFASFDPPIEAEKKGSKTCLIVSLVLGGLLLCVLCCCGGGYFLMNVGGSQFAESARLAVQDDPTVQEHIGEIQSIELDWMQSIERQSQPGEERMFAFTISGTKGSGTLTIYINEANQAEAETGELLTEDGELHYLGGDPAIEEEAIGEIEEDAPLEPEEEAPDGM